MAISNEMVRLYKERFGRGPTKVRTHWVGPDVIAVLLEDTLTPVERSLAAMGEHQRLRDLRTFFQYATVPEFCEPIERLTGRKVRAFISGASTPKLTASRPKCSSCTPRATTVPRGSTAPQPDCRLRPGGRADPWLEPLSE
jgi:uncharacterized protein YbcI